LVLLFPANLRGISGRVVPVVWAGTSSLEFCLLFRVRRCSYLPGALASSDAFLGVAALLRGLSNEVHSMTGFPSPVYVPPSAFLTLSTAFSFATAWACFIPLPRPRFALQGFPPTTSRIGFRQLVPSYRWCRSFLQPALSKERARRITTRRLQGFGSDCWSVVIGRSFRPTDTRFPPELRLPRGFLRIP
jgi:hypothetical protein